MIKNDQIQRVRYSDFRICNYVADLNREIKLSVRRLFPWQFCHFYYHSYCYQYVCNKMINPSDQRGGADLWLWLSNLGFVKKSPRVFRPANGSRSIIQDQLGVCIVTSSKRQKITLSSYWSILQLHSSWPPPALLFKLRTKAFLKENARTYE